MAVNWERDELLKRTVRHLAGEFRGTFSVETIEEYVRTSLEGLEGARVKDFLPIFVNRFARERLKALARAEGLIHTDQPEVLFVCVHNAGRSQIAAALTAHLSAGRVIVRSAGSDPAGSINPMVIQAMTEIGLDLSEEFPKPLTDEVVRAADAVITMGCGDACPIYPGKRYEDWEVNDPAGESIEAVRIIRDDIRARVEKLLTELQVPVAG